MLPDPNNSDPNARQKSDLYVHDIEVDHREGPDGTLKEFHRITVGKRGMNIGAFANHYDAARLPKDNPFLWEHTVRPIYEGWLKNQKITHDGFSLEAWHLTKGQIKACKGLGIHTVEGLASASSVVGDKLGPGGRELMAKAQAFVDAKDQVATANKVATQALQIEQMTKDLAEAQESIARLTAGQPKPQRRAA